MLTWLNTLKRRLVGRPLATERVAQERLSKVMGLAVFSSDNLSSVAYATEQILRVLVIGGVAAMGFLTPLGMMIVALFVIVVVSYRQTIHAYSTDGGAYIVAKDNLGILPGLVAAAALLIDYVLTVAVSIAAGVAAITSAVPGLYSHRVLIGVVIILVIAIANLRGVRESGALFAGPTYFFIVSFLVFLGGGLYRLLTGTVTPMPAEGLPQEASPVTLFLLLSAFAQGCAALTGVEAISNGVAAFKPPESRNAAITLTWMGLILAVFFLGITLFAHAYRVIPTPGETETVVSQIAQQVFGGRGPAYYSIQAATAAILLLAANTSFAGFPRLGSMLARDNYFARQLANRGDRLVYSNGIIILAVLAALLIIAFGGSTARLIPLYAVGVFLSFTLSQAGMVRRWWRRRTRGWQRNLLINGVGAAATGIVTGVIALTKFTHGAWIVLVLIPLLVLMFRAIHRHYQYFAQQTSLERGRVAWPMRHVAVVPVAGVHRGVTNALMYAQHISDEVRAVYINLDDAAAERMRQEWARWDIGVPLDVIDSPYRSILGPFLEYLDGLELETRPDLVTVVIPEVVAVKWWHHFLHNQTALRIKGALLFRRNTTVISVPSHLTR